MKSIKKITNKVTDNFSALAGSALLVGATLTGGAALASAQSGSSGDSTGMDLGDYPQPFVTEDGQVQTSIVLGSDAAVTDVVGATEIAGSLGNAAFGESSVSTGSSGAGASWSAANGVTLDTSNDNLYYGDAISEVRDTLTSQDLSLLEETEFEDDSGTTTDITQYVNIGDKQVSFGNGPDGIEDDEDPLLHVPVPSESDVDSDDYLLNLQANFGDSIDFSDSDDVQGEEIRMFGQEFTVADKTTDNTGDSELILYGDQQTVDIATGESTTVTVGGEEVTIEVVSADASSSPRTASLRIDGDISQEDQGEEITVNGENIRIDEVINTGATDNGEGIVQLAIGSQELRLTNGNPIEDGDENDVEGTRVYFNGDSKNSLNNFNGIGDISSIDVYLGAQDDDNDYLAAGETFKHDLFEDVEAHFGGLSPDAASSEDAAEVSVETNGDADAQVSFTGENGNTVSQDFIHDTANNGDGNGAIDSNDVLADSDNDDISVTEGETLQEDDYLAADAGDFSHMWEVTSIDRDSTGNLAQGDEATIDLRDVATGNTVEVDIDAIATDGDVSDDNSDEYYAGEEIIDGQSYKFVVSGADSGSEDLDSTNSEADVQVVWGDSSSVDTTAGITSALDTGATGTGALSMFTAVDTANNGAVSFTEEVTGISQSVNADDDADNFETITLELPSTQSTDAQTVELRVTDPSPYDGNTTDIEYEYSTDGGNSYQDLTSGDNAISVGSVEYIVNVGQSDNSGSSLGAELTLSSVAVDDQQGTVGANAAEDPAAVFMQPENEDDNENAFVLTPTGQDADDGYSFNGAGARAYTGSSIGVETLEGTDDDVNAGYNEYGTYVRTDTQDAGSVELHMPAGQSTAGAAFSGADGSLSASAGGSGSVMAAQPTYEYADGVLADDGNVGQVKNNDNVILVGGPAANSLTQELVDDNQTMPGSEYTEGQGMIQMVDGFSEGNRALVVGGYSGEDTRAAAQFLADYRNNQDSLEGQSKVTIETSSGSVAQ